MYVFFLNNNLSVSIAVSSSSEAPSLPKSLFPDPDRRKRLKAAKKRSSKIKSVLTGRLFGPYDGKPEKRNRSKKGKESIITQFCYC